MWAELFLTVVGQERSPQLPR